jgi:glycosyltransferase involved in cell wall biosynthesis
VKLDDITPLILTYDEAPNLARTLDGVAWARQIVVIDSGSTDGTLEIAAAYKAVTVFHRHFDSFAAQSMFGLQQVRTEWTLALDADYVCSPALATELEAMTPRYDAYNAAFEYAINGRPLRATLYPERPVLFRTSRFGYEQDGHAHRLATHGAPLGKLTNKIVHDDRKSLARWLASQSKYAEQEAEKILNSRNLSWKDRLRRGVLWAPPLTLAYCLFAKGLILDGWPGIFYSLQRTYAELALSLELLDRRLKRPRTNATAAPPSTP